jgi:hypothetical protein
MTMDLGPSRSAAIAALLALPATVQANQPRFEAISLERLVKYSPLIVAARRASPFAERATAKTQIADRRGRLRAVRVGVRVYRFHVTEVLHDRLALAKGLVGPGARPVGVEAAFDREMARHALRYRRGVRESPIYERYGPRNKGSAPTDEESILFLAPLPDRKGAFAFPVHGAFESLAARPKVRAAIAAALRPAPASR